MSTDPSSVRTSLRTPQKPNQAPARTRQTSRKIATCNCHLIEKKESRSLISIVEQKQEHFGKKKKKQTETKENIQSLSLFHDT